MTILVTGVAGFIGSHVAAKLLDRGDRVIGLDNLNAYYDVSLKEARLAKLLSRPEFLFSRCDVAYGAAVKALFELHQPNRVVHLAAQAGVRYSLVNPQAYVDANLAGFVNILEGCRASAVEHLVYASSSSVYGGNTRMPFSERDPVDHPVSLYAATKKANELMAHTYSHLFRLPSTGLRFFTVYGPWGRPDMALFLFTDAILSGRPIELFNNGEMIRDFTYVDDVVEGILRVLNQTATPDPSFNSDQPDSSTSNAPYRLFNIGNGQPSNVEAYVAALEDALGMRAERIYVPMQPGDVAATHADTSSLKDWADFQPITSIERGVAHFVQWYRDFYNR